MGFLTNARRASFRGLEFPWTHISIRSSQRVGIHEYAYLDGADLEKLNRKPYQFSFSCTFDENLDSEYPNNLSQTLPTLQALFEAKTSAALVLPRMGTVKAFLADYREDMEATVSSGVNVALEFIEENNLGSVLDFGVSPAASFDQLDADMSLVLAYRASLVVDEVPLSEWDKLQAAVNALLSLKDKGDLYASKAQQKLLSIDLAVRRIDEFITQPAGYQVIDSLRQLWVDSRKLASDSMLATNKLKTHIVQRKSTIGQVAATLYGDTSRSIELLQLNDIDNAFAIPAGARVRYYELALRAA